ncbi:MAG: MucR family transcriptional regulator, partial [Rhodobiaceae bacterium]|nr:MucR family transcriptional regulator [Rhodobiaceae bacterium]
MQDVPADDNLIELTADIVAAYISNNTVNSADLPKLIFDIHSSLKGLSGGEVAEPVEELKPAVNPRRSVTPDYIVCLEDG